MNIEDYNKNSNITYTKDDLINISMVINLINDKELNNNILKIIIYYYNKYENDNKTPIYTNYYNRYKLIYNGETSDLSVAKFNLNNLPNPLVTIIYNYLISLL